MASLHYSIICLAVLGAALAKAAPSSLSTRGHSTPVPFTINTSCDVPRMLRQVADARIPSQPEYLGLGSAAGMDLDVLKELRHQWTTTFDWNKEQTKMNQ